MRLLTIFLLTILFSFEIQGQLRDADLIRISEAKQISRQFGELIWRGFNKPTFSILYVTDNMEYLMDHYYQSDDFERLTYDTLIQTTIHQRPTQMNKYLLATFPFEGIVTVFIGTPENTGLNSTEWIITLLHEHFHQYQYTSAKYFLDLDNLNLANGDKTGMWQLNYPFPYQDSLVNKVYDEYTETLYNAVKAIGTDDWEMAKKKFFAARKKFKESLAPDDYKYISFQWYQEGIARYTEYAFLEKIQGYEPSVALKKLPDFIPFDEFKDAFYEKHLENVKRLKLKDVGRITTYDVGFAEALILREINPDWNKSYLRRRFDLEKLY